MSNEEMILKELRSIRLALEITAPKRWQKIPEASKTLGIPQSRIRVLADAGTIPVSVLAVTKSRKHYLVDVVKTWQLIEEGGIYGEAPSTDREEWGRYGFNSSLPALTQVLQRICRFCSI